MPCLTARRGRVVWGPSYDGCEDLGVSNRKTTVCSLSNLTESVASARFLLLRHAETALPDVQRNKFCFSQELPVLWVTSYCWLYLLKPGTLENKFITLPVTASLKKNLCFKHILLLDDFFFPWSFKILWKY